MGLFFGQFTRKFISLPLLELSSDRAFRYIFYYTILPDRFRESENSPKHIVFSILKPYIIAVLILLFIFIFYFLMLYTCRIKILFYICRVSSYANLILCCCKIKLERFFIYQDKKLKHSSSYGFIF